MRELPQGLLTSIRRLKQTAHYQKLLQGTKWERLEPKDLNDFQQFPFMDKSHLKVEDPYSLFSVPMKEVVRIHATSGTTGTPVVAGYTQRDIDQWAEMMANVLRAAGVKKQDRVQIMFGYGLFTGGLGFHYGVEKLGATVIPASIGNTERQIDLIQRFKVTTLIGTPTYLLYLGEALKREALKKNGQQIRIERILCGAEPWSEQLREKIQDTFQAPAYDNYGLTELIGPGVAYECVEQNGLHINEEHFFMEVIDPQTGQLLPAGEQGELVFSSLTKEAFPMIRYRTGDIAKELVGDCPCGRKEKRISRILGRTDDMVILKGVNFYPKQIEDIFFSMDLGSHFMIRLQEHQGKSSLILDVESEHEDSMQSKTLSERVKNQIGLNAKVRFVAPHSLPRFEGKARRVIDERTTL